MARTQLTKQYLNFVGGLNTESSPLQFPENTAKSIDNVDLLRDGSIKRRRGMDYETASRLSLNSFANGTYDTLAVTTHEWTSVDGQDDLNFLVIQVGGVLHFHDLGIDPIGTTEVGTIDLTPVNTNALFILEPIDSAVGKGKLFITSRYLSPHYIQFDRGTDSFTGVKVTIKIRDHDGLDEEVFSPEVFGDDIIPPAEQPSPVMDIQDVIPSIDDDLFDGGFYDFAEGEWLSSGGPSW